MICVYAVRQFAGLIFGGPSTEIVRMILIAILTSTRIQLRRGLTLLVGRRKLGVHF